MYEVKKADNTHRTKVQGAIIPLSNIRQNCMLFPRFSSSGVPDHWSCDSILDVADSFLINNWSSKYAYQTIW